DPSLADTRRLVIEAARRGADVIELGVPFSDPLADGPVIQRAGMRALAAGTTLQRLLEVVSGLRAEVSVPLVLLTYYNPVLAFGLQAVAPAGVRAGGRARGRGRWARSRFARRGGRSVRAGGGGRRPRPGLHGGAHVDT